MTEREMKDRLRVLGLTAQSWIWGGQNSERGEAGAWRKGEPEDGVVGTRTVLVSRRFDTGLKAVREARRRLVEFCEGREDQSIENRRVDN